MASRRIGSAVASLRMIHRQMGSCSFLSSLPSLSIMSSDSSLSLLELSPKHTLDNYCRIPKLLYSSTARISLRKGVDKYKRFKKNDLVDEEEILNGDEDGEDFVIVKGEEAPDYSMEELMKIVADQEKLIEEQKKEKELSLAWRPGQRKRSLWKSNRLEDFQDEILLKELWRGGDGSYLRWSTGDRRCGMLGIKVGMLPVYDPVWGQRFPCTVIFLDRNIVLGHKTRAKHGYDAVVVAAGERKRKNVGKSVLGQYTHLGPAIDALDPPLSERPPYLVREFRVHMTYAPTDKRLYELLLPPVGTELCAMHFVPGQNIDVAGISKGKGFQGGMKRHNFGGMPASHGTSKSHRSIGSTGQCQDPGRVFKGKKMPGHMGHERVTVQNLRLLKIDRRRNLLYLVGAVPGNKGEFVEIRDAVKRPLWGRVDKIVGGVLQPPLPTWQPSDEINDEKDDTPHIGTPDELYMPLPPQDPTNPDFAHTTPIYNRRIEDTE